MIEIIGGGGRENFIKVLECVKKKKQFKADLKVDSAQLSHRRPLPSQLFRAQQSPHDFAEVWMLQYDSVCVCSMMRKRTPLEARVSLSKGFAEVTFPPLLLLLCPILF